jgi:cell division septation protein DedD
MNMEKHISALLYSYDCVIIPGLGGFVSNYAPAQIHPTQHTFSPPHKSLVFNRSLKNNDGLLANRVSQEEGVSYADAINQLNAFAISCLSLLSTGKKLVLADIGTLYQDIEKNIQFEPALTVNYLTDSFGLTSFQSPAIKRDNFAKRLEREPKDREVVPAEVRRRISVKKYVALTLTAMAVGAMIWIPLGTDLLKHLSYANLNPFHTAEKTAYTPKPLSVEKVNAASFNVNPVTLPDTAKYAHIALTKKDSTPVVVKMKEEAAAESTAVSNVVVEKAKLQQGRHQSGDRFSVIGGCFAVPENAERYVAKLKADGFDPFILETNHSTLRHVSYGTYPTYAQAAEALAKIRSSNKDAWMLIK